MSNQVAEVSAKYLAEAAKNAVPMGYKHTEVGVIPEEWVLHSLDEVCSVIDGDRGSNYPNGSDFIESGYCVFLSATNVTKSGFRFDDVAFITKEKDGLLRKGKLLKGDIVLTTRGSIGNFAYFDDSVPFTNLRINSGMVLVRCTTLALDAKYLFDVLRSSIVKRQLETMSFGSAQPQLTVRDINAFYVYFPANKEEQTAIASALSDVDALISELEKLIAKKQAIKTATMQQLLTGRTRLPQFALREDGTPTNSSGTNLDAGTGGPKGEGQDGLRKGTKPSELGEIPEDWEVVSVGELGQVDPENLGAGTSPDYEFEYVSLEQIDKGTLLGTIKTIFKDAPSRARRVLKKGDVLVSTVRPNLMSHFFVNNDVKDTICSTGFSVVRFYGEKLCPGYLYQHLFSSVINNQIEMLISGSNYPAINSGDVKQLKVQIGSVEEQTAIATILSDMDEEIQVLEQRLSKTRQIKQGMMQELLTGKTRLVQPLNKESQHG